MAQFERWYEEGVKPAEARIPDGGLAYFKIESAHSPRRMIEALSSGVEFDRLLRPSWRCTAAPWPGRRSSSQPHPNWWSATSAGSLPSRRRPRARRSSFPRRWTATSPRTRTSRGSRSSPPTRWPTWSSGASYFEFERRRRCSKTAVSRLSRSAFRRPDRTALGTNLTLGGEGLERAWITDMQRYLQPV